MNNTLPPPYWCEQVCFTNAADHILASRCKFQLAPPQRHLHTPLSKICFQHPMTSLKSSHDLCSITYWIWAPPPTCQQVLVQFLCSREAQTAGIKGETREISDLNQLGVKKPLTMPRLQVCQTLPGKRTQHTPPLHTQNTEPAAETWGFAKCQVTKRAAWLFFFLHFF